MNTERQYRQDICKNTIAIFENNTTPEVQKNGAVTQVLVWGKYKLIRVQNSTANDGIAIFKGGSLFGKKAVLKMDATTSNFDLVEDFYLNYMKSK